MFILSDLIDETLKEYPLAIKMMFNYDAESNFSAIYKAMHKEVLPANYLQISEGFMEWKKRSVFYSQKVVKL